ncbi:hypothetical protein WR25_24874 [Diploscapter pachys]|uniref:Uncharacterized protein n=1 Tax=Diploscapter pachys TaxID=2018661 RepID=A0A2A2L4V1_9BILA|nr:hypothetical protein WR25_24874 [Diploscapter pachys]
MHSPLPVALPPLQPVLSLSLCISSIPSTLLCLFLLSTALLLPLSPVHSAMISPTHCNATSICPACCAVLHSLESCLEDDYHEKFMIKVNGDGVLGAMYDDAAMVAIVRPGCLLEIWDWKNQTGELFSGSKKLDQRLQVTTFTSIEETTTEEEPPQEEEKDIKLETFRRFRSISVDGQKRKRK